MHSGCTCVFIEMWRLHLKVVHLQTNYIAYKGCHRRQACDHLAELVYRFSASRRGPNCSDRLCLEVCTALTILIVLPPHIYIYIYIYIFIYQSIYCLSIYLCFIYVDLPGVSQEASDEKQTRGVLAFPF